MADEIDIHGFATQTLLFDSSLERQAIHYPLGFPVEINTNCANVIAAATESWAVFTQGYDESPLTINVGVLASDAPLPLPPRFRSRQHMMSIISDADNFLVCDLDHGAAFGWVTSTVAANHAFLRYHFLDAAALTLVEQRYLAPVHGALVARHGHGLLLCGESLAGKSTLAYACARAGWTYISDDGTFLLRSSLGPLGIGDSHRIRLREDARQLFPELMNRVPITRANGKSAIEIPTRELPIGTAASSPVDHLVFLNRHGEKAARLRRYSKNDALAWCQKGAAYGSDAVRSAKLEIYQRLTNSGAWELNYSDLDEAVARLEMLATEHST